MHQQINTIASVAAALFAAAALALGFWQTGADDRKASAFRDQCRSEVGAALELVERSRSLNGQTVLQLQYMQRDWQLLRDRLTALRNVAPSVAPDDPRLIAGVTDAADLAERYALRTDLWTIASASPGNQKVLDGMANEMANLGVQFLVHDAGLIR